MVKELSIIEAEDTVPYQNLALEEYLLHNVGQGQCILYLWQNRCTVVIGKNQNAYKECQVEGLKAEGGFLARRISGGGAVFHDLGNLNFTFLAKKEDYSVERQTQVILEAVKKLGIDAEKNGRNDITVEGRKISGNAYYQAGDRCFHHGTILLSVDKEKMSRYLQVSREKLQSKSVDSVRSRVANLTEFVPGVSVGQMKKLLIAAFEEVYGLFSKPLELWQLNQEKIGILEEKYSCESWNYGQKLPFTHQLDRRFSWGEVLVRLQVFEGRVKDVRIYSDALDTVVTDLVSEALLGGLYDSETLKQGVMKVDAENELQKTMKEDLAQLLDFAH